MIERRGKLSYDSYKIVARRKHRDACIAIVGCCGLRAESSGGSNKSAKTRDSVNDGIRQRTEINIMRMNRIDRGL